MVEGFDFNITENGELSIDSSTHDIKSVSNNDLKIQSAINRIKSVSKNWFIDEIGADLEELIGKSCTSDVAEYGKNKIIQQLTFDDLWNSKDFYIKATIIDNVTIVYNIYLKLYQNETEGIYSEEITATLDLVKGVFIKFGWEPRR